MTNNLITLQELMFSLNDFWSKQGCLILQPYDMEVGAGTFHPETFLRAIGPEPWKAAHVQASRRPTDGRYGEHPNRTQKFYQYQVMLKPVPENFQELYLESLRHIGINPELEDIRFVEDNWESPTLGAWGLGWEVWQNGMEITQFTYFQQVGGIECEAITGELAYGIERIAMNLQNVDSNKDIIWARVNGQNITYGDMIYQYEKEMSAYNFDLADTNILIKQFSDFEQECTVLLCKKLPIAAYEMVLKASHTFNILDARSAISVTERQNYILRVRKMAKEVAQNYLESRQEQNFPLLNKAF